MNQGRPFSQATIGGNPVGRPRTAPPEPSPAARALIAAQNWQAKRGVTVGQDQRNPTSIQSGASVSAARGAARSERRFEGEDRWTSAPRPPRIQG